MFIESAFWIHSFLEESGIIYTFEGARKNCTLKTILRIHNPHFYWNVLHLYSHLTLASFKGDDMQENYEFKAYCGRYIISGIFTIISFILMKKFSYLMSLSHCCQVMIEADLGLADSYINGDFSFVHKYEGLLNLFPVR